MKNLIGVTSAFFRIPLIVTLIPGFGVWYSVRGAVVGHGDRAIAVGNRARPGLRASGAGLAFAHVGKCRALDTSIPVSPPADILYPSMTFHMDPGVGQLSKLENKRCSGNGHGSNLEQSAGCRSSILSRLGSSEA